MEKHTWKLNGMEWDWIEESLLSEYSQCKTTNTLSRQREQPATLYALATRFQRQFFCYYVIKLQICIPMAFVLSILANARARTLTQYSRPACALSTLFGIQNNSFEIFNRSKSVKWMQTTLFAHVQKIERFSIVMRNLKTHLRAFLTHFAANWVWHVSPNIVSKNTFKMHKINRFEWKSVKKISTEYFRISNNLKRRRTSGLANDALHGTSVVMLNIQSTAVPFRRQNFDSCWKYRNLWNSQRKEKFRIFRKEFENCTPFQSRNDGRYFWNIKKCVYKISKP